MPTETFDTPGEHEWTVPERVTEVTIDAWGAEGQAGDAAGGKGGHVQATISVTPGETYTVTVGEQPTGDSGGYPDGGSTGTGSSNGGGSSAFWNDRSDPSTRRVVGAGGAGGGRHYDDDDAATEATSGGDGGPEQGEKASDTTTGNNREGGHGGTQDAGGAGGNYDNFGSDPGEDGSFAQGGDAYGNSSAAGGAGGGGWYGGGGGEHGGYSSGGTNYDASAGGGGGSNYIEGDATDTTSERGTNSGDGRVELNYSKINPPEITSIDSSGDSITLAWTGDDWDAFKVYRHIDTGAYENGTSQTDTTNTIYTDSNVNLGTRYYYQVVGYLSDYDYEFASNEEFAETAPPEMTGFALDASIQDELTVELEDILANTGLYRIRWKRASADAYNSTDETTVPYDADPLEGLITSVLDGEKYDVGVRAEANDSVSDWHTASEITKLVPVSSLTYTLVHDTEHNYDSDIKFTWHIESDYDGVQQVWRYEYRDNSEPGELIATIDKDAESYTESAENLHPGRDYIFTIRTQTDYVHADASVTFEADREGAQAAFYAEIDDPRRDDPKVLDPPKAIRNATLRHTATSDVHIATQDLGPALRDLATLNPDVDLRTRLFDASGEVVHDERIFKGVLGEVETQGERDESTLKTKGRGWYLAQDTPDSPVEFSNTLVWQAIEDYVSEQLTDWTVDVTPDSGTTIVDDGIAQNPSKQSDWEDLFLDRIGDTDPFEIHDGALWLLQTCWTREGEEFDNGLGVSFAANPDYSGNAPSDGEGEAAGLDANNEYVEFEFSVGHTIPESGVGVWIRAENDGGASPASIFELDGNELGTVPGNADSELVSLSWRDWANNPPSGDGWTSGDLDPGTHTLRIEITDDSYGGRLQIDVVAPADNRFSYNFDSDVTTLADGSNVLDGPELYPDVASLTSPVESRQSNVDAARLTSVWDDTSNNQAVAVSNTGGSSWVEETNASDVDANFFDSEQYGSNLQVRLTLSRYGEQDTTPRYGHQPQSVDSYDLRFDQSSIAVIDDATYSDTHKSNLTALCERGRMSWVIDHTADGKVLEIFPIGTEAPDEVSWSSTDWNRTDGSFDYANRIVVRGAQKEEEEREDEDDIRYEAVVEDEEEIQKRLDDGLPEDKAIQTTVILDPEMGSQDEVNSAAFSALEDRIESAQPSGSVQVVPTFIKPGYAYAVPEFEDDDGNIPTAILDQGKFSQEFGSASGTLQFEKPSNWVTAVDPLESDVGGLKRLF